MPALQAHTNREIYARIVRCSVQRVVLMLLVAVVHLFTIYWIQPV